MAEYLARRLSRAARLLARMLVGCLRAVAAAEGATKQQHVTGEGDT
jgi:hypothetical protein